jgi:uncharacterized coiled-coil protein SlyX
MKLHKLFIATAVMLPMIATAAKGDNNGKPFQELSAVIEGNRTLIDANTAGIDALRVDVTNIESSIAAVQFDLDGLFALIGDNDLDLAELEGRVAALETGFDVLNADLSDLRADHAADMLDVNLAIANAEVRIGALESELQTLTDSLNVRLAGIDGELQDNAMAIDSLLVDLSVTSAKALSNMMAINGLEGQVADLNVRAAQHEADIAALQLQIDALDTRISGLESAGTSCASSAVWQPVDCTTNSWVWTSDRTHPTLDAADQNGVLWVGDQHANIPNTCSLDGTGWVSTEVFTMQGCNTDWRHIGGSFSGNCGGHDGDQVRRLTMNPEGCFDYTAN